MTNSESFLVASHDLSETLKAREGLELTTLVTNHVDGLCTLSTAPLGQLDINDYFCNAMVVVIYIKIETTVQFNSNPYYDTFCLIIFDLRPIKNIETNKLLDFLFF